MSELPLSPLARNVLLMALAVCLGLLPHNGAAATQVSDSTGTAAELDNAGVTKLARANMSEETILLAISSRPCRFVLGPEEIIALKESGVSEVVLRAMLAKATTTDNSGSIILPDGLAVHLRLQRSVSSASTMAGDPVPMIVAADVKIGDVLVIAANTPAEAVVKAVSSAKRAKISGKIELDAKSVTLVDGSQAKLRIPPEEKTALSSVMDTTGQVLRASMNPLQLGLKHGKEIELPPGLVVKALLDGNSVMRNSKTRPVLAEPLGTTAPLPQPTVTATATASLLVKPEVTGSLDRSEGSVPGRRLNFRFPEKSKTVELYEPLNGNVVSSHRIIGDVRHFRVHPEGRRLYLVCGKVDSPRLTAYDLESGAELGYATLPHSVSNFRVDRSGRRLLAMSPGSPLARGKKNDPRRFAHLSVWDAESLQNLLVQDFGVPGFLLRYLPEVDRVFLLSLDTRTMWFVDPASRQTTAGMRMGGIVDGTVFLDDGKRLLAMVRSVSAKGEMQKAGQVRAINLANGETLAVSPAFEDSGRLVPLGDRPVQAWVVGNSRMQRVSADAKFVGAAVSLKGGPGGLDGLPGSAIHMGELLAVSVLKPNRTLAHRLALIDPEQGKILHTSDIGRSGVRAGKTAGRWALAIALSAASGAAAGAAASAMPGMIVPYPIFFPGQGSQAFDLVCSENCRQVYALDVESSDITAVRADGSVAAIIPVKGANGYLWNPGKGPLVYLVRPESIAVIDSQENRLVREFELAKGEVFVGSPDSAEFVIFSGREWTVYDATTAEKRPRVLPVQEAMTLLAQNLTRNNPMDKEELVQLLEGTDVGRGSSPAGSVSVQ